MADAGGFAKGTRPDAGASAKGTRPEGTETEDDASRGVRADAGASAKGTHPERTETEDDASRHVRAAAGASAKGTRPEKTKTEDDASRHVRAAAGASAKGTRPERTETEDDASRRVHADAGGFAKGARPDAGASAKGKRPEGNETDAGGFAKGTRPDAGASAKGTRPERAETEDDASRHVRADAAAPAKGTRPEGVETEADASRQVREMFGQIAPRYDLLNHLLSFELDRLWRARAARLLGAILKRPDALVLDLCCGTGDLALALAREGKSRILGADFSHPMLVYAMRKSKVLESNSSVRQDTAVRFLEADALRLPFADASFDLVTTAFGFRNLSNYEAGLREIQRVLKPGGTLAILEFTEPPDTILGNAYRWYCRTFLPRIGGLISGNRAAYAYLPKSVSRFFSAQDLASLMSSVGYSSVEFRVWTIGTVALHTGIRPG